MIEPSTGEAAAVTPMTVSTRMCSSAKSSISAIPEVIAAKGAAPRADCNPKGTDKKAAKFPADNGCVRLKPSSVQ